MNFEKVILIEGENRKQFDKFTIAIIIHCIKSLYLYYYYHQILLEAIKNKLYIYNCQVITFTKIKFDKIINLSLSIIHFIIVRQEISQLIKRYPSTENITNLNWISFDTEAQVTQGLIDFNSSCEHRKFKLIFIRTKK